MTIFPLVSYRSLGVSSLGGVIRGPVFDSRNTSFPNQITQIHCHLNPVGGTFSPENGDRGSCGL